MGAVPTVGAGEGMQWQLALGGGGGTCGDPHVVWGSLVRSLIWGFPCRVGVVPCKALNRRTPGRGVSAQGPCHREPCGGASARFLRGWLGVPG